VFAYDTHNYWVSETMITLSTGQRVTLHLSFTGRLDNHIVGFYKTSYVDDDTGQRQ